MAPFENAKAEAWQPKRKAGASSPRLPRAESSERIVPLRFTRLGTDEPSASQESAAPAAAPPPDEEALRQAFGRGVQEGRALERAELAAKALAEWAEFLAQFRAAAGEVVLELAVVVAERILRREIERDPDWVAQQAAECIGRLPPNGPLKLRLHPRDRERLLSLSPRPDWLSDEARLRLVADTSLSTGECVVESERGRVDGRRAASLEAAREVLRDVLAQSLAEGKA